MRATLNYVLTALLVFLLAYAIVLLITHGADPSHAATSSDFLVGAVRGAVGP